MESSAQGPGAAPEQATREFPSVAAGAGERASAPPPPSLDNDPFAERPELYVGAAFAGGLIFAKFLKRFGR
jgi:hypothetical protein